MDMRLQIIRSRMKLWTRNLLHERIKYIRMFFGEEIIHFCFTDRNNEPSQIGKSNHLSTHWEWKDIHCSYAYQRTITDH